MPEKTKHASDGAKKETERQGFPKTSSYGRGAKKLSWGKENSFECLVYALPYPQFRAVFPGRGFSPDLALCPRPALILLKIEARLRKGELKAILALGAGRPSGSCRDLFLRYLF